MGCRRKITARNGACPRTIRWSPRTTPPSVRNSPRRSALADPRRPPKAAGADSFPLAWAILLVPALLAKHPHNPRRHGGRRRHHVGLLHLHDAVAVEKEDGDGVLKVATVVPVEIDAEHICEFSHGHFVVLQECPAVHVQTMLRGKLREL